MPLRISGNAGEEQLLNAIPEEYRCSCLVELIETEVSIYRADILFPGIVKEAPCWPERRV